MSPTCSSPPIPGSAASTSATAPTAASTSSTGAIPASATTTTASTGPRAGSTRSPTEVPAGFRSATCRSSTRASWSPCTGIPTSGSSGRPAASWPTARPAACRLGSNSASRCASLIRPGSRPRAEAAGALVAVRDRRGRRAVPPRPAGPRRTSRCAPGPSGCSPTTCRSTRSSASGSARTSSRLPTSWRSSPPWHAMTDRAWSGWCWPRRSSGCPSTTGSPMARALLSHAEDADDHNLPSLIWTGLIPVADADPQALAALAADARMPALVGLIARRLGEDVDERPAPVNALLSATASRAGSRPLAAGRLGTRRRAWPAAARRGSRRPGTPFARRSPDRTIGSCARTSASWTCSSATAARSKRSGGWPWMMSAGIEERKAALRTLIDGRPPDLRAICERLVRVRFVNSVAVRGLALFDDPQIGQTLARNYRAFHPAERPAVIEVLVSRPAFAMALLDQVAAAKIPRDDLTPFHARQIQSLGDPAVTRRLGDVWGALRGTAADRQARIAELKKRLDARTLAGSDRRPRPRPVRPPLRRLPPTARPGRPDRTRPDRLRTREHRLSAGEHRRPRRHSERRLQDGRRRHERRPRAQRHGQGAIPPGR